MVHDLNSNIKESTLNAEIVIFEALSFECKHFC